MDTNTHSKLIMAVVQEDDYDATVSQLNKNGFFVTMLSSTGGFWKKKKAGESRSENVISVSLPAIRQTHRTVSPERWCMRRRGRPMRLCCFAGKTHGGVKRWSMWRILWRNLRERKK